MYKYTNIKGLDLRERKRNAYNFSASLLKQARLTRFTRPGNSFYLRFVKSLDFKLYFAIKILRGNLAHKSPQFRSFTWTSFNVNIANVKISSRFPCLKRRFPCLKRRVRNSKRTNGYKFSTHYKELTNIVRY